MQYIFKRKMLKSVIKKWGQFSLRYKDGMVTKFSIIDLPKELVNDFIEFQINNYVKKEFAQQAAGIPYSSKALDEYRDILKNQCMDPLYRHVVCCPEIKDSIIPDIVGSAVTKFVTISDRFDDFPPARTKEVAKLYEIDRNFYRLFSIPDFMVKHDVDEIIEYMTISVHSDYQRQGFATKFVPGGPIWHKLRKNNLAYAWFTSEGSQKLATREGWVTEFKIRSDELVKKWNVTLKGPRPPPFFTVMSLRF